MPSRLSEEAAKVIHNSLGGLELGRVATTACLDTAAAASPRMGAKDIGLERYTDMKRYIETRCLEELGCKPLHAEKSGLNTVDESQK